MYPIAFCDCAAVRHGTVELLRIEKRPLLHRGVIERFRMAEVQEIRSRPSGGGGCFSWVLGRRNRNKPGPVQPVFVKSLSKKEILDKHASGKWEPGKQDMTLLEDLSEGGSYHSLEPERGNKVEEEVEKFEGGFGSDEDEDDPKHRRPSRQGAVPPGGDRLEMLMFDEDGSETASPSVLASVERDSEVRFGLSGGRVRKPSDEVTPKGDKRVEGGARRARKLEYGDGENRFPDGSSRNAGFDGIEEEELPGGVRPAALSPASRGRRDTERADKKAWGASIRSDWIGGMR